MEEYGEPAEPQPLGDILSQLFIAKGWGRKSERERLERVWNEIADPVWVANTRIKKMVRGVLEIEVNQSIIYQELVQFYKRKILVKLRSKLKHPLIHDIKFILGTW